MQAFRVIKANTRASFLLIPPVFSSQSILALRCVQLWFAINGNSSHLFQTTRLPRCGGFCHPINCWNLKNVVKNPSHSPESAQQTAVRNALLLADKWESEKMALIVEIPGLASKKIKTPPPRFFSKTNRLEYKLFLVSLLNYHVHNVYYYGWCFHIQ